MTSFSTRSSFGLLTSALCLTLAACDTGNVQVGGPVDPALPDAGAENGPDAGIPVLPNVDAAPIARRTVPAGRVSTGLEALYVFDGVTGEATIQDHSGNDPAYPLTINDPAAVSFTAQGMVINGPMLAQTNGPPTRLINACRSSDAMTIEAWAMSPPAGDGERGRVVSLSLDPGNRNFDLANDEGDWNARLRTEETGNNGANPSTSGGPTSGLMQHIAYRRLGVVTDRGQFFVDGVAQPAANIDGAMSNWNLNYELNVGNEATLDRPFSGTLALVAVYCRALSPEEIEQNRLAGYL